MEQSVVFAPETDERALDREVEKIDESLQSAGEITPEIDDSGIDDVTGISGGSGGGGGGSGMGAGAGAAAGLASKIPKPISGVTAAAAIPVALTGLVGMKIASGVVDASARLQTSMSLIEQGNDRVQRAIGDQADKIVRPLSRMWFRGMSDLAEVIESDGRITLADGSKAGAPILPNISPTDILAAGSGGGSIKSALSGALPSLQSGTLTSSTLPVMMAGPVGTGIKAESTKQTSSLNSILSLGLFDIGQDVWDTVAAGLEQFGEWVMDPSSFFEDIMSVDFDKLLPDDFSLKGLLPEGSFDGFLSDVLPDITATDILDTFNLPDIATSDIMLKLGFPTFSTSDILDEINLPDLGVGDILGEINLPDIGTSDILDEISLPEITTGDVLGEINLPDIGTSDVLDDINFPDIGIEDIKLPDWSGAIPDMPSWGSLTPSLPNWDSLTPSMPNLTPSDIIDGIGWPSIGDFRITQSIGWPSLSPMQIVDNLGLPDGIVPTDIINGIGFPSLHTDDILGFGAGLSFPSFDTDDLLNWSFGMSFPSFDADDILGIGPSLSFPNLSPPDIIGEIDWPTIQPSDIMDAISGNSVDTSALRTNTTTATGGGGDTSDMAATQRPQRVEADVDTAAVENKLDRLHRDMQAMQRALSSITLQVGERELGEVTAKSRQDAILDTDPTV